MGHGDHPPNAADRAPAQLLFRAPLVQEEMQRGASLLSCPAWMGSTAQGLFAPIPRTLGFSHSPHVSPGDGAHGVPGGEQQLSGRLH